MAKGIIITNGNGGDTSEDCTVTADKVVAGSTYIGADTDDEIGIGTLTDQTARTSATSVTNSNNTIYARIPKGAYRTAGTSGYPEIAIPNTMYNSPIGLTAGKLLAGQSAGGLTGTATNDANAAANQILSGRTAYIKGAKVTGNIVSMAAQTITPSTSQQTLSCAGKYLTGNVTVPAFSLPPASAIKKGYSYTLYGKTVVGTWSGFVPGSGDIYINGAMGLATGFTPIMYMLQGSGVNYITGVRATITFETGMIRLYGGYWNAIRTNNPIDLSGWSNINVEAMYNGTSGSLGSKDASIKISSIANDAMNDNIEKSVSGTILPSGKKTLTLDISNINGSRYISFGNYGNSDNYNLTSYIYRIWLS